MGGNLATGAGSGGWIWRTFMTPSTNLAFSAFAALEAIGWMALEVSM